MHIAEVVTIAKSLPLLRLNTYKSLILSYSADYRRIFLKNIVWVLQLTLFMQALEDGREKNVTFAKIYGNKVYAYGKLYPF